MTAAKTLRGKNLFIKVSDGAGTPVFAHPCLINAQRGIVFSSSTNSIRVPDCTDPELISWISREKTEIGATINGAGVLHTPDTEFYFNWVKSPDPIAVRVELNGVTGANGGGYFAGDFHCTNFEVTGDVGQLTTCSIGLENDGAVTWTDAS